MSCTCPTPFTIPITWLGSIWLYLCLALALAMAFHIRDLDKALNVSEAKSSKTFTLNPDGLVISTLAEGRLLKANDAFLRLTLHERSMLIGKTILELDLWPEARDCGNVGRTLVSQGFLHNQDSGLRVKGGEIRDVMWSAELIQVGDEVRVLAVICDINERKRAEAEPDNYYRHHLEELVGERTAELSQANVELQHEIAERRRTEDALRQSRADLQAIFDSLQDFFYVLDDSGRIVAVNPICKRAPGLQPGGAAWLVGGPVVAGGATQGGGQCVRPQPPATHGQGRLPGTGGDAHHPGTLGHRLVLCAISRDISERQRTQEMLRQLAASTVKIAQVARRPRPWPEWSSSPHCARGCGWTCNATNLWRSDLTSCATPWRLCSGAAA